VVKKARPQDYDSLVLPGGQMNPDSLRMDKDAIVFIKAFVQAGKPVAAICHGPWTLIDAGAVKGKKMTSWPTLHTDLQNAGAKWVDQEVVRDGNLITSRKPEDIPAFSNALIEAMSTNVPGQRMAGSV
jgi:protease I